MKKFYLLLLSFIYLSTLSVYAENTYDNEMEYTAGNNCSSPCKVKNKSRCPQTYERQCPSECFLCTNKNINTIFEEMNLSETQICTAMKIQDKYELEVLSINERIQSEEENLCYLKENCAKSNEIRKQRNLIKDLKKKRKEICECYEKQFEEILSGPQRSVYRKNKKLN